MPRPKKIPIREAEGISQRHSSPMVVIFALNETGDRYNLVTYGKTKKLCRYAASLSEQIADAIFKGRIVPAQEEPLHLPDKPTQFEDVPKASTRTWVCPNCKAEMTPMGCIVSGGTLYWCPACGTIKPCDGVAVAPATVPSPLT